MARSNLLYKSIVLVALHGSLFQQAHAAEPTAEDRERARTLLFDGRERSKQGDYDGAVKAFKAAHEIMGVPTTGLDLAKGLIALGRFIEARAVALDVTRMPSLNDEPLAFGKARTSCAKLAEELAARIPSLVITIKHSTYAPVEVVVDGTPLPPSALGLPWKVDPGQHVVTALAKGFQATSKTVAIDEAATLPVELTLTPAEGSSSTIPDAGRAPPTRPAAGSPHGDADRAPAATSFPTWTLVAAGAGLVATGVGVAFAVDYANTRATVASDCPDLNCDWTRYAPTEADALESRWNRSLGLAIGFGAIGVLGMTAAVVGVVSSSTNQSRSERSSWRSLTVGVGTKSDGVTTSISGRF